MQVTPFLVCLFPRHLDPGYQAKEEVSSTIVLSHPPHPNKSSHNTTTVEDLTQPKKELLEARLRVAKKDLEAETDKNQRVLKQAAVRTLIERLAQMK